MTVEQHAELCEQAYQDGYVDALSAGLEATKMLEKYRRAHGELIAQRDRLRRRVSVFAAWAMVATAALIWGAAWVWWRD